MWLCSQSLSASWLSNGTAHTIRRTAVLDDPRLCGGLLRAGLIAQAERQKVEILKEAAAGRDQILAEAKEKAGEEAARIVAEAKQQAEQEKEAILASARGEVAMIAVQMATKVLRGQLDEKQAQQSLQEIFADEAAQNS